MKFLSVLLFVFAGYALHAQPLVHKSKAQSPGTTNNFNINPEAITRQANQLSCNNWLQIPSAPGYVTVGDLDIPGTQITVEATFNRTTPYFGGPLYAGDLVSKHTDPKNVNYLLRPNSAEITTSNGYFSAISGCEIELNKTYHVAMVYNGSRLSFYRNGFLMASVAASGTLFQNDLITRIGYYNDLILPTGFVGYINEVRIWNVARTQAELQTYMNASLPSPATQTGLLAYYTFEDVLNKQGNTTWNGVPGGTGTLNKANPTCTLFKADSCCTSPTGTLKGSTLCTGGSASLTFTASSGTAPYTLTYSDGTTTYKQDNVTSNVPFALSVNPAVTTNYKLVSIADINGCSVTSPTNVTAVVVVNKLPLGSFSGNSICEGSSPTLQFRSTEGVAPFVIKYGDGVNIFTQSITSTTATFLHPATIAAATSFQLMSIGDANGCSNLAPASTAVINVNPLPQGNITGETVCRNDSARFIFHSTTGVAPFSVTLSNGISDYTITGVADGSQIAIPDKITSTSNTYTLIRIKEQTPAGCERTAGILNANASDLLYPSPDVQFAPVNPVCINDPAFAILSVTEINGAQGTGKFTGNGISASGNFRPAAAGAGSHMITYTFTTDDGCQDTAQQQIMVNPLPNADAGSDHLICPNTVLQLNASGGETYSWSPVTGLSNPSIANPIVNVSDNLTYTVTVTNAAGCTSTDKVDVIVSLVALNNFRMPNAFTPNGDGIDDCFGVRKLLANKINEFAIFDRWGKKVFSTKNPQDCWDGRLNGQPQPAGGYVYILNAVTDCGNINTKGMVLLLR